MCGGVEVDPVKTGALLDWPTPCIVKDVRRVFEIGAILHVLYSKLCLCGNPTDGFRQRKMPNSYRITTEKPSLHSKKLWFSSQS